MLFRSEARLLALLGTRIARQEAAALELTAKVRIGVEQRARDAVAQRVGLGRDTAAVHARDDVHLRLIADGLERLADGPLEGVAREELAERLAVDHEVAGAGLQDDAGDGGLALARRAVARIGGEVDRDGRDRLLDDLVLSVSGSLTVGAVLGVRVGVLVLAVDDDVDLQVRARNLGLDARSGGLLVVGLVRGRGDGRLGRRDGLLSRSSGLGLGRSEERRVGKECRL